MDFFSSLSAVISGCIKELGADLSKFTAAIKPVVIASAEELGRAAFSAVVAHAPLVMSGQEKLNAAIASVKTNLSASGKSAGLTVIHASVQEAYDLLSQAVHKSPT